MFDVVYLQYKYLRKLGIRSLAALTFLGDPCIVRGFFISYLYYRPNKNPFSTAYVRPGYYQDWILENTGIDFDWDSSAISPKPDAPEYGSEVQIVDK